MRTLAVRERTSQCRSQVFEPRSSGAARRLRSLFSPHQLIGASFLGPVLKNYFTVAWRTLRRNPVYTTLNIVGLAIGLAACIVIGLYLRHELSYDDFHAKADRIYRLMKVSQRGDNTRKSLYMPAPLGPSLVRQQPAIESAVRLYRLDEARVERGGEAFYEDGFYVADSTFFSVFGYPLLKDNPQSALAGPYNVVISERMADKYFGEDENPLGKTITLRGQAYYTGGTKNYTVTGVARVPQNSHLQFNFLTSYATLRTALPDDAGSLKYPWRYSLYYTYLLLDKNADPGEVESAVRAAYANNVHPNFVKGTSYTLQPLESIHLYSNTEDELRPGGDPRYLYILAAVALLILGVACVNYTNLATARAAKRAQEVGVRKTLGATRLALVRQFIGEALIFSFLALGLALVLARLALPFFLGPLGEPLTFSYVQNAEVLAALVAVGALVGLLSGSYPALFLSRFRPASVLGGRFRLGRRGALLRGGLLVFQFGVSIALVASTFVFQEQLEHVRNRRLGLDAERVVTIHARSELDNNYGAFKNQLLQQTGIENVSAMGRQLPFPVDRDLATSLAPEGVDPGTETGEMRVNMLPVELDFTETMGIPVVQGRDLTREVRRGSEGQAMPVLINEAAAEAFGWKSPVGKMFDGFGDGLRVVGVVQDFHYQSLKAHIEPLVLRPLTYRRDHVVVRVQSDNLPQTIDRIEKTWADVSSAPLDYAFLNQRFGELYRADERLATLIGDFALLAVLVACLGLFGLAAYAAERRRKEIGIRKALGASARDVVALLSKDFLGYVAFGFALAVPVAWYGLRQWLEDFAYRIEIGTGAFALAGVLVLSVALVTVGTQALRAAWVNPAYALKDK